MYMRALLYLVAEVGGLLLLLAREAVDMHMRAHALNHPYRILAIVAQLRKSAYVSIRQHTSAYVSILIRTAYVL